MRSVLTADIERSSRSTARRTGRIVPRAPGPVTFEGPIVTTRCWHPAGGAAICARLLALALVGGLWLLPQTASAGTLDTIDIPCAPSKFACGPPVQRHRYSASPAEVNDVTVARTEGRLTLRDEAGVTLAERARQACAVIDAQTVTCTDLGTLPVALGDEADRLTADLDISLDVDGGPGDDTLTATRIDGGSGDDTLTGVRVSGDTGDDRLRAAGSGPAVLDGGPGRDDIAGGPGGDDIHSLGGPAGSGDTIDGGPGQDRITYEGAGLAPLVDLADPALGTDRITGVEDVRAGRGVIRGDDRPNVIDIVSGSASEPATVDGRGGNDAITATDGVSGVLIGGAGDDVLRGDGEHVTFAGGDGDDRLTVGDRVFVDCGRGIDRVAAAANADSPPLTAGDCEHTPKQDLIHEGRRLLWYTACPTLATGRCRVRLTLADARGRDLTRRSRDVSPGSRAVVAVAIPQALANRRRAGARIVLRLTRTATLHGELRRDSRTTRTRLSDVLVSIVVP